MIKAKKNIFELLKMIAVARGIANAKFQVKIICLKIKITMEKLFFVIEPFKVKDQNMYQKAVTDLIFDEDHNIKTYDRGEFFDDLWVTKFENNYYSGVSKIKNSKAKTIQAWFQTSPYGSRSTNYF